MTTPALDALAEALTLEVRGRRDGGRLAQLLVDYAREHDDWRAFAFFDDAEYTSNRVLLDDDLELRLLCWGAGQVSPIHDHAGQDCWMAVLDGELEEVRYATPDPVLAAPMEPTGSTVCRAGDVAFVRDEIALHLVRNPGTAPASSLHLYVGPYAVCDVFDPATGRRTPRALEDYSIRGERIMAP